jgi:peptidoglycan/LPS O-acetylase OafA/YrhL
MRLPQFEKWSVLAALRFLLASIVAVAHLPNFTPIGGWSLIVRFGPFEAVLGFLLISGYSIGASYIKEPNGFIQRRIKRIYPIYLASIALTCVAFVLNHSAMPPVWEVIANVLFLNQIVTTTSFVVPAWSLALEFWLYCLTPLLFLAKDATLKKLVWFSFAAFVAYICGRTLFHWQWFFFAGVGAGLNLLLLSFIWITGLRLARHRDDPLPILKDVAVFFAGHMALAAVIQFGWRWKHGDPSAFFTADLLDFVCQASTLAVVWWAFVRLLTYPGKPAAPSTLLRWLGDISYPLYLVHFPIYFLLKRAGLTSPVLYFLLACAASAALYKVLDRYSQRRHLRPAKSAEGDPSLGAERI